MFNKEVFIYNKKKILRILSFGLVYVFNLLVSGCSGDTVSDPVSANNNDTGVRKTDSSQSSSSSSQSDTVKDTHQSSLASDSSSQSSSDTAAVSSSSSSIGPSSGESSSSSSTSMGQIDTGLIALYGIIAPEYGVQIYEYRVLGEVVAADNGEYIEGIEVRVRDNENGYVIDALTDNTGTFEISTFDTRLSRDFVVEFRDIDGEENGWFNDKDTTITATSGEENRVNVQMQRKINSSSSSSTSSSNNIVEPLYGIPSTEFERLDSLEN